MFGQHNISHDDTSVNGAPALPPDATSSAVNNTADLNTAAVSQFGDSSAGLSNSFMPSPGATAFSGASMNTTEPLAAPFTPVQSFNAPAAPTGTTDDLVRMKQEALQHLQPLVSNLQQSPEEEFRTLMMMIQATDDRSMLQKALEAAKRIGDDKLRAQAMLDVINEINYFTQTAQE